MNKKLTEANNHRRQTPIPKLNVAVIGAGLSSTIIPTSASRLQKRLPSLEYVNDMTLMDREVGSLAALKFARNGHEVHVYEYREDIRTAELVQGRSINLALSQRGRKALAEVDLEKLVLSTAIPMKGRMLHDLEGHTSVVLYDPSNNQCLYSVGRKYLNEVLLNGDKYANTRIFHHFNHKLNSVNINDGLMGFTSSKSKEQHIVAKADLIVGCDGAFSPVRQQMIKNCGFNYSQEYIEHGYLELCIPAKNDDFQMPPNYLHIWPRDTFMMIALPNQDKSFTVTVSMPFTVFDRITSPAQLLEFFGKYYKDAIPLIGEERLINDFFQSKPQFLVSIKCNPYHYASCALLLGDAAHAMVPYYGQGLNAGMEDCSILFSLLDQPNMTLEKALQQFTEMRCRDAHAICDLAMYNYTEMRDLTKRLSFRCRKLLDTILYRYFPTFWVPLYNSVSFTCMPYSKCIANREWQDQVLERVFYASITILLAIGIAIYIS